MLSARIAFWVVLANISSPSVIKALTLLLPKTAFWTLDRVSLISSWASTVVSLVTGIVSVVDIDPAGIVIVPALRV